MKVNLKDLYKKKQNNQKAVLITAYDYSSAKIIDNCDIDIVLTGDSAAMVMLGYKTTLEISLDEMIMLARSVRRGIKKSYFIVDMPFMSYQISKRDARKNCGKVLKKTQCDCVKMEGGLEIIDIIKSVIDIGIPVCGHIGMQPQKYKLYNGYPVMGKTAKDAEEIIKTGFALEQVGANMLIIENVTSEVSKFLSENLKIPVYTIGSGTESDGQIIVYHDILGLYPDFKPRFIKQYENLQKRISIAINKYAIDVRNSNFPQKKTIPHLSKDEIKKLKNIYKL